MKRLLLALVAACANPHAGRSLDASSTDTAPSTSDGGDLDGAGGATPDGAHDASSGAPRDAALDAGAITGGPCESGAQGATLLRARFDHNSQGDVVVVYEEIGAPDNAGLVGMYGYNVGFTPIYDEGLLLDSHDFVDVSTSTASITHLTSVTLSLYTTGLGGPTGFMWQGNVSGQTAQYAIAASGQTWYSEDVTPLFAAGEAHAGLRIKTLPSDNAMAVAKLELCVVAN